MDAGQQVTLIVAGKPLTFTHGADRVEACLPPHVPVPRKGPCKGHGELDKLKKSVKRAQAVSSDRAARKNLAKQYMIRMAAGEKFDVDPKDAPDLIEALNGAPPMNLAHVQITGKGNEHLFQRPLRDIPRDQMPALPDTVEGLVPLIHELGRRGVKVELIDVDPRTLQATQSELSAPKVAKMAGFMKSGWKPGGAMIVSRELALGDGHHRWAGASMAALLHEQGVPGYQPVQAKALKIDLPIDDLLKVMNEFSGPRKSITEAP